MYMFDFTMKLPIFYNVGNMASCVSRESIFENGMAKIVLFSLSAFLTIPQSLPSLLIIGAPLIPLKSGNTPS